MKIKKLISVILVMALAVSMLACMSACGNKKTSGSVTV